MDDKKPRTDEEINVAAERFAELILASMREKNSQEKLNQQEDGED